MAPLTGYSGPFEFFADMFIIKGAGKERTFTFFHDVVFFFSVLMIACYV